MIILVTALLLAQRFSGYMPGVDSDILDQALWLPIVGLAVGVLGQRFSERRS